MIKGCNHNSTIGNDLTNNSCKENHETNNAMQSVKGTTINHLRKITKDKDIAFKLLYILNQPAFVEYHAYQRDIVSPASVHKSCLLGL